MTPEYDTLTGILQAAATAVVTVGAARGFVVEAFDQRLIITTAQCLPHLSRPDPDSDFREFTFFDLLGPLDAEPTVSAECLFVDSVADVAVLGEPTSLLDAEKDAYKAFVGGKGTLRGIGMLAEPCEAWLLTLNGDWQQCRVRTVPNGRSLIVVGADQGIAPGTSGSPILSAQGQPVGIVSLCNRVSGEITLEQHGQPLLASVLPVWLFTALTAHAAEAERHA